jgi:hypothetical protein
MQRTPWVRNGRAGELYSSLDIAAGGRIQRFGEQLQEVEKGLANSIDGVDAEGTKTSLRATSILKARSAAVEKIKAAALILRCWMRPMRSSNKAAHSPTSPLRPAIR